MGIYNTDIFGKMAKLPRWNWIKWIFGCIQQNYTTHDDPIATPPLCRLTKVLNEKSENSPNYRSPTENKSFLWWPTVLKLPVGFHCVMECTVRHWGENFSESVRLIATSGANFPVLNEIGLKFQFSLNIRDGRICQRLSSRVVMICLFS